MNLIVVTGLSGSGKSIALNTLEDMGFYCIDNLPVFLLQEFARRLMREREQTFSQTAVGVDARSQPEQLGALPELVKELRIQGIECRIVFLEADTETLIKRFRETRRKHPLAHDDRTLGEAIELERQLLEAVLTHSDLRVDTTHTNVHQLRDLIRNHLCQSGRAEVALLLQSFGFKHGVPRDVDFVFDMRCLPNPHWEPELRPLTGLDPAVARFLEQSPQVRRMQGDLIQFLEHWIPHFEADGRSYLTVALGCTGGQHRSVFMTEHLRRHFEQRGRKVMTRHRELP